MNYLERKKLAIMRSGKFRGYLQTVSGTSPLTIADCMPDKHVTFSISGNSVQNTTPAVDAPVEIKNCGDLENDVEKALLAGKYSSYTDNGITWTSNDNSSLTIHGTATGIVNKTFYSFDVMPSTEYSFSITIKYGAAPMLFVWDGTNNNVILARANLEDGVTYNFTTTNTTKRAALAMYIPSGDTVDCEFSAQVWRTDKPYKIPVKYSGLNLTNVINKIQSSNFSLNVYVEAGKPYSIKLDDFSGGWNLRIYATQSGASGDGSEYLQNVYVGSNNFKTFTPTQSGYLRVNGYVANSVAFNCSTIMLVEGSYTSATMPSYEQYYEPVTHNVYIPEPLYGSEGIYDTVAADYSNKTAEVEQQWYKYVMTGDESNITGGSNSYGIVYGFRLPTGFSRMAETTVLCNHCETPADSHSVDNPSESVFNTSLAINTAGVGTYMYFFVPNTIFSGIDVESDTYTSDLCERFVAWLKERYAQGDPVEVVYRLSKSITTDVSVMQDWGSVPMLNRGTAIITAETEVEPSAMTVEYYSRTKE